MTTTKIIKGLKPQKALETTKR